MEGVLARFDGDAHAALAAALEDVTWMRQELQFSSLAMSYGFARTGLRTRKAPAS